MNSKGITVISITSLDFDKIARMSDKAVYNHLVKVCRISKKRIVPARLKHDGIRISRAPDSIYVHFFLRDKEKYRVGFVPA